MGVNVEIKWGEQVADFWICLTSGCVKYEEGKETVYLHVDDRRSDGLRIEKSITLRKREGWNNYVHTIMNDSVRHTLNEPKADEAELVETAKFISEKYRKGYFYIGVKSEFVTPRGIRVYFRVRNHEKSDRRHIIVELIAVKDGERLLYQVYGDTEKVHTLLEEIANAIGAYVLFSEYVTKHAAEQTAQQDS
jgi:hypothetical protein